MADPFVVCFVPGVTPTKWERIWRDRMRREALELRPSSQSEALAAVTRAGGVAQKAVSGKTDVLVAGDGAGRRKAEAAAERGVRVIDARTFLGMVFPDSEGE